MRPLPPAARRWLPWAACAAALAAGWFTGRALVVPGPGPPGRADRPVRVWTTAEVDALTDRVNGAWDRIEAGLRATDPAAFAALRGRATPADLAALERRVGLRLPPDVRASLSRHDGADGPSDAAFGGFALLAAAEAGFRADYWERESSIVLPLLGSAAPAPPNAGGPGRRAIDFPAAPLALGTVWPAAWDRPAGAGFRSVPPRRELLVDLRTGEVLTHTDGVPGVTSIPRTRDAGPRTWADFLEAAADRLEKDRQ